MRASFSGTLVVGLARVGLKAHPVAVEEPEDGNLHWLHRPCKARLVQSYTCGSCGSVAPKEERVKGIEHEGQWLLFEEEELRALEVPAHSDWPLETVVPLSDINLLWTERFYYLFPATDQDVRPYMLFSQTLATRQEGGVFTFTTRRRARLGIIRPGDPGLVLHVLRFAEAVRSCQDYGVVTTPITLTQKELQLAKKLLEAPWLRTPFRYQSYVDPTKERLTDQVQAKLSGKAVKAMPPSVKAPPAQSLIKMLELSIARAHGKK